MSVLGAAALMATLATPRSPPSPAVYDVAVFGATPGGIMAAIGARRANVSTASGGFIVDPHSLLFSIFFNFSTLRLRLMFYYSIKIALK